MIRTHHSINNTWEGKKKIFKVKNKKIKKSELINQLPNHGRAKKIFKGQKS